MSVLLLEITAATDSAGTTTTLRYGTEGYNHPSAPGLYMSRIKDTVNIRRELRGDASRRQGGSVSFSDIVLINADGALDALADYGFDGRQVKGLLIDDVHIDYSNATTLFTATMGPPSFTLEEVSIPVRDRLAELDQKLHSDTYAGTNTLPDGLEGTEDDIKGRPKPEPEGGILNAQPPFVNTSKLIWQFSNGSQAADVTAMYEGGIALTRGTDYTSETDLLNNAPASGEYRVWPRQSDGSGGWEGGYFRAGSSPTHTITCDIQAGSTVSDRTVAQVLQNLALRAPTISSGDISSSDVSNLDSSLTEPVGLWQPTESTILREMEKVATGAGVYFGFDRDGLLRFGEWKAPASPVVTFKQASPVSTPLASSDYDLVSIEGEPTNDSDIPVFEVIVKYRRNYTVQADLQTAITDARRALVENEWRRAKDSDTSVQDQFKNARSIEVNSSWATETGAADAATRILTREKPQRRRWVLTAALKNSLDQNVDLADTVTVNLDRYDMIGGKNFRTRWLEIDPVAGIMNLGIWG